MAGGDSSLLRLKSSGTLPSMRRIAATALSIAALAAIVTLLAGVRTAFDPWGRISPGQADGGPVIGFAFAMFSAFGSGIGLVAIVGVAVLVLVNAGRRSDAAFVAIAVFGAVIMSRPLKAYFLAMRPASPDWVGTSLADAALVTTVAVCVALGIGAFTRWRVWVAAALAIGLAALIVEAWVDTLIPIAAGYDSFPSGHALNSMTFAAVLAVLAWSSHRARYPVLAASAVYAICVGLSRVYLHAHLPADVAAGWCIALVWAGTFRFLWVKLTRACLDHPLRVGVGVGGTDQSPDDPDSH